METKAEELLALMTFAIQVLMFSKQGQNVFLDIMWKARPIITISQNNEVINRILYGIILVTFLVHYGLTFLKNEHELDPTR